MLASDADYPYPHVEQDIAREPGAVYGRVTGRSGKRGHRP